MCSSFHFIEQQAYQMSEMIRKESLYRLVGIKYVNGKEHKLQENYSIPNVPELITKLILEDKEGLLFLIEPSENGLSFAKGQISYREYKKRLKKESTNLFVLLLIVVGFFSLSFYLMMKFMN